MIINITDKYSGKTIKDYLFKELLLSHSAVKRLKSLENGITVNNTHVTVRYVLKSNDVLSLQLNDTSVDENKHLEAKELPLDILYEDEYMIALNKRSGMPTHPSHNHHTDTLANALAFYFEGQNTPFVFRAVNRLDCDTSGIVLVAKSRHAAARLAKVMQSHGFEKAYSALVWGDTENVGTIKLPIMRLETSSMKRRVDVENTTYSKSALTRFMKVETKIINGQVCSLVKAFPITGRTHQLRVHFSYIGHPILGDGLYGKTSDGSDYYRLALHCYMLSFTHPFTGENITIEAPQEF